MALFRLQSRDDVIAILTEERNHLRARVTELEKQLLAIHDAHAYRLMYQAPPEDRGPGKPHEPTPYERRGQTYEPKESLVKLQEIAKGKVLD